MKTIKLFTFSIFLFAFMQNGKAQNQIAGTVNDASGKPLPYKFTLELSGNYRSAGYFGVAKSTPRGTLNFGIQKKLSDQ